MCKEEADGEEREALKLNERNDGFQNERSLSKQPRRKREGGEMYEDFKKQNREGKKKLKRMKKRRV